MAEYFALVTRGAKPDPVAVEPIRQNPTSQDRAAALVGLAGVVLGGVISDRLVWKLLDMGLELVLVGARMLFIVDYSLRRG